VDKVTHIIAPLLANRACARAAEPLPALSEANVSVGIYPDGEAILQSTRNSKKAVS
jgi:hypothetical protein